MALTFAKIAYNLMSLFKHVVLQEKIQKRFTTLKYRVYFQLRPTLPNEKTSEYST